MNRKLSLLTALAAGLLPLAAVGQVSPVPPPSSSQPAAPAAPQSAAPQPAAAEIVPQAIPAKIAVISFEQAVIATNEGQRTVQELQKKYEPKKAQIDALTAEVDGLKKKANATTPPPTAEEHAAQLRTIDAKEKQLNLDMESASNAYQADLQDAYSKVAQKVNIVMQSYVKMHGFTFVYDVSGQQSSVMWIDPQTDITEAIINAYNSQSGVAAPPPAAPAAGRPAQKPATSTTPHTTTTPKPPSQ
jgi:Skp family chaperone for outer membrane proteins